jgi:hypothetical protein
MQLKTADGRHFNFFLELDNGTEPVRSQQQRQSIERKIRFYERLQDAALAEWGRSNRARPQPPYRVPFFTRSTERMQHILLAARMLAPNPDRRVCLGVSIGEYLAEPNALRSPLALDHHGRWQGIVNEMYASQYTREPIRLKVSDRSRFGIGCAT